MNISRSFAAARVLGKSFRVQPIELLQSALYSSSSSWNTKTSESTSESNDQEQLGFSSEVESSSPTKASSLRTDLPRPSEIPWQKKVANSVSLIGSVHVPVQFQASSDGKFWAGSVLTQEEVPNSTPLLIPIIFEGDLAHIAAFHLKEKDLVHVAGHLSGDPSQSLPKHLRASIQVMVQSISFVQESREEKKSYTQNKKDERSVNVSANKGSRESRESLWRDLVNNPKSWSDCRQRKLDNLVHPKYPDFKHKDSGEGLWFDTAPKWALPGIQRFQNEEQLPMKRKVIAEESWKDLVENPDKWWDNRVNKRNEKSPDFKHKDTGEGLWLGSSPSWVLEKLPPVKPRIVKTETLLS